ncbi:MAG: thioredoxin family protein [bacterium]|nr:thioredoxin family protein [bacterium]
MKLLRWIPLAIMAVFSASCATAPTSKTTNGAMEIAEPKPILLEFGTTWCQPCKIFQFDLENSNVLKEALAAVELRSYDAEDKVTDGFAMAKKYGVTAYPTFIVLEGEEELGRWSGYVNPDHLAQNLGEALGTRASLAALELELVDLQTLVASMLAERSEYDKSLLLYRGAAALNPENDYAYAIFEAIIFSFLDSQETSTDTSYELSDVLRAADAVLASPNTTAEQGLKLASLLGWIRTSEDTWWSKYAAWAVEHSEGQEVASPLLRKELKKQLAVYN